MAHEQLSTAEWRKMVAAAAADPAQLSFYVLALRAANGEQVDAGSDYHDLHDLADRLQTVVETEKLRRWAERPPLGMFWHFIRNRKT